MIEINPNLYKVYAFWSGILIIKVLFVVALIGKHRFHKKIFINQDDFDFLKLKGKPKLDDPDIERVRRAHLNDLENVLPWLIMTYIWLWTNPPLFIAKTLISTFVIARIIHTLAYAVVPLQPLRAISFFIGYFIIGYEALSTVVCFV